MWQIIQDVFSKLEAFRNRRKILQALALHRRGEVRQDGLRLASMCNSLHVEWHARDVHPWDRGDPTDEKRTALVTQTLADTYAAVCRLFTALPQVDVLEIRVFGVESGEPILEGIVSRPSFADIPDTLSVGMKLRQLGIVYHSGGLQFESLDDPGAPADRPWMERHPEFATFYKDHR